MHKEIENLKKVIEIQNERIQKLIDQNEKVDVLESDKHNLECKVEDMVISKNQMKKIVKEEKRENKTILYMHDSVKLINTHLVCFSCLKEEEMKNEKLEKVENEEKDMEEFRKDTIDHLDKTSFFFILCIEV